MTYSEGKLFDDALLGQIRERFSHMESDPVVGPRVYLENAGGTLTLKKVVEAVTQQTALPDNEGRANPTSQAVGKIISQGRQDVLTLLGATSGTIMVGESTTSNAFRVLNAIICDVPGDNVVTTNLDHPATYATTKILANRFGKDWRAAHLSPQTGAISPESVANLVDSRTILLAVIHSSNVTGQRNDIKQIISAARRIKPDLYVVVDGATYGNHGVLDVDELGCDVYLLSSYKLFSKIGASVAYLSDRTSQLPYGQLPVKPSFNWELGTREPAGYAAWSEVVNYLCWLGEHFTKPFGRREAVVAAMNAIELHERALTFQMLKGQKSLPGLLHMDHVSTYGQFDDLTIYDPCLAFNVHGLRSNETVAFLQKQGIRVHNRTSDAYSRHTLQALNLDECVRVSAAHYNSPQDISSFLDAIERAKSHDGKPGLRMTHAG